MLREYVEDDWPAVLAYQSKSDYLVYYPWSERSERDVREFLSGLIAWQREEPRYRFQLAITLPEDGRLIGSCGIRKQSPASRVADIGYELDPAFWGRGYATEAAREMVSLGFGELGVHRVWSWIIAENRRSARVLERLGLRVEGRLRDHEWFKGRWWDHELYGLLAQEWEGASGV